MMTTTTSTKANAEQTRMPLHCTADEMRVKCVSPVNVLFIPFCNGAGSDDKQTRPDASDAHKNYTELWIHAT